MDEEKAPERVLIEAKGARAFEAEMKQKREQGLSPGDGLRESSVKEDIKPEGWKGLKDNIQFTESLILAQDERWRRA